MPQGKDWDRVYSAGWGREIALVRTRRRLSQTRLAQMTGFDRTWIGRCEAGHHPPGRGLTEAIIEELRLPMTEADNLRLAGGFAPQGAHHDVA